MVKKTIDISPEEKNFLEFLEKEALEILSDIRSGKEDTLSRKEFFKKLKEDDDD
jgi:hypothetical protein